MTSAVDDLRGDTVQDATARGMGRALLPLGIVTGGVVLAVGVQLVFDPFRTDVPLCLVYHLTGLHCPGCGAIRAVHSLLAGDLLLALRSNLLITASLPLVALGFAAWTVRRVRGTALRRLPASRTLYLLLAVVAVFTVLRNLPAFWYLAPVSFVGA
ncbi:DUF2752 domain-containing protein [Brachybacterium alimentarium]|uniref:DUF2752 domain-containing protein n=1 Tax=Brachybacterium alimentarium TaxID=47845 RepID=UPI003FD5D9A7